MFANNQLYKNSQKSIAIRAQFHNLAYAKMRGYQGFIDPTARGEEDSKPTPESTTSIAAVEQLLTQYTAAQGIAAPLSHLITTIGLCLLKLSGDTSHSTVGQQIENAVTTAGYNNKTFYLVQERPYFARLVYCNKNIIMNADKAKKALKNLESNGIKPFENTPLAKKLLLYETDLAGQVQAFYDTLLSTNYKLVAVSNNAAIDLTHDVNRVGDLIYASEAIGMPATQDLLTELHAIIHNNPTPEDLEGLKTKINAYKTIDEYKKFQNIKDILDLPLDLGLDNTLLGEILSGKGSTGFSIFSPIPFIDNPAKQGSFLSRLSKRVRKSKGQSVNPSVIEFNPMFIFSRKSHQLVKDVLPFFYNLKSFM
jgi:hypothetical protein